ncbi:MAG: hypothetical protein ACOC2K_04010, partial [Bacteroidota bacterium]
MQNIVQSADRDQRRTGSLLPFLIAGLMIIFSQSATAQFSGGGYAEAYTQRDIGARPIAMAGAYTAVSNEPNSIFYNPGGLGFFSESPMFSGAVSSSGFGRTNASLSWAQLVYDNLGVGVGINSNISGSFQGRNILGQPTNELQGLQYNINMAAAYRIEFMSMGLNVKYLTNNLLGSETFANGYGIDIGTKFHVMDMFSAGIAVQNISAMMFWNNDAEDAEPLPYTVRAGVAMEYGLNEEEYFTRSTVTGDLERVYVPPTRYILLSIDGVLRQYHNNPSLIAGVEASVHEMLAFRGGLTLYGDKYGTGELFPMNNWGAGISLRPQLEELFEDIPFDAHIDYT